MNKFNLAKRLFDLEESDSDVSGESVIYLSSDESEASEWETDCSTDTEKLISRIEKEVTASPMLIGGRIMTVEEPEDDNEEDGPSCSKANVTPKLGPKYFDHEMCYAPPKRSTKSRIEICNTIIPVAESPMSPPPHERGPSLDTPIVPYAMGGFHASYHVQNTLPYENVSESLYTGCMVCGRSADAIKREKVDWYVSRTKSRDEPEYITQIRRDAYMNGLNAGAFLFITPAVSQAAACDGTPITTTAVGQDIAPGTLPTF